MKLRWSILLGRKGNQAFPWPTSARFQLGQLVCHHLTIDDEADERHGQTFHDYGLVVGVIWNPNWWIRNSGWIYTIKWLKCNSYPHDTGLVDEIEEARLHPANSRRFTRWIT